MPEPTTLFLFAGAALALLVVPGPSVIYIVTRGIHQGRAAALVSVVGVTTATLVHTVFAAAGLSAILASSATAFSIVKYAGSAYLIYLAIRTWRDRSDERLDVPRPVADLRRVYLEGFLVNLLNPKTALFILALLPQFVDPARGAAGVQILLLGGILASLGLLRMGPTRSPQGPSARGCAAAARSRAFSAGRVQRSTQRSASAPPWSAIAPGNGW